MGLFQRRASADSNGHDAASNAAEAAVPVADVQSTPEAAPQVPPDAVPQVPPQPVATNPPPFGLADFPLLPQGTPLWSDAVSNVVDLEAVVPHLPESLLVLEGPTCRAAALIVGGAIVDAVWVNATGGLLGEEAARALMSTTEGTLTAHRIDDPRLVSAVRMLWRGPRVAVGLPSAWLRTDEIVAEVRTSGRSCGLVVDAADPGAALFESGELVAVYTLGHPWPATSMAALRGLLHAPDALVVVIAQPSPDTATDALAVEPPAGAENDPASETPTGTAEAPDIAGDVVSEIEAAAAPDIADNAAPEIEAAAAPDVADNAAPETETAAAPDDADAAAPETETAAAPDDADAAAPEIEAAAAPDIAEGAVAETDAAAAPDMADESVAQTAAEAATDTADDAMAETATAATETADGDVAAHSADDAGVETTTAQADEPTPAPGYRTRAGDTKPTSEVAEPVPGGKHFEPAVFSIASLSPKSSPEPMAMEQVEAREAMEFVPARLDIDVDALRSELTAIAVEWLGADDSVPVATAISGARAGVDDFVAAITAIGAMEIPGHETAVVRAMAREMHFRATEVLCGV